MNENGTRPLQPQADQTGVQADSSPAPLIVTKLRVPRRRSDLLPRRRLVDFIHTHLDRRLILVSAPAGYGKTTLLTEFAHDTDLPVCWYTLDPFDRDLHLFLEHFIAAIAQRRRQKPFISGSSADPSPPAGARAGSRATHSIPYRLLPGAAPQNSFIRRKSDLTRMPDYVIYHTSIEELGQSLLATYLEMRSAKGISPASSIQYTCSHTAAAGYIRTWVKNTDLACSTNPVVYQKQSNWNPAYQPIWCNDCANYVSQALKRGGHPTTATSFKGPDAVRGLTLAFWYSWSVR